ncbi:MAG: hypothetical protein MUF86_11450, partial [Akkermansiaceae bacterium]|nr:hypothetical protein [Akkermansiaceae bacterium]
GDEIDLVKAKLQDMVRKISAGQPRPDVRYGLVAYRDKGDEYGVDIVVDFSHGGMALGKFGDNGRYQLLKEKENGSQPHWKLLDK